MSDSSAQNKTEKPTQKKIRDAKKKGQIPRSKELVNSAVLMSSSLMLFMLGSRVYDNYSHMIAGGFVIKASDLKTPEFVLNKAMHLITSAFSSFVGFGILLLLVVYIANIIFGGQIFTPDKILPKLSNISPSQGIKKVFSAKGVAELLQSIIKTVIIFLITYAILKILYPKLLRITDYPVKLALSHFGHYFSYVFLVLSFSTIIILFFDVPFQLFQHNKKLKMSKQEIKDEFKQTEGNPQIKRKLRSVQRQASKRRKMLKKLPEADILITNPTHFAVALKYDEDAMDAPIVLVMGADLMAMHIRRLSTEYSIPILEIPLLARALYYNSEVGEEIPEALFQAVAQVVAYIFRLDDPMEFYLDKDWVERLPIPEHLAEQQKD